MSLRRTIFALALIGLLPQDATSQTPPTGAAGACTIVGQLLAPSTGAAERNRQLSLERAQSVAAALVLYGVESNRLAPRGFGPDQPVADNADEEGRQQNRRVELVRIP